MNDSGDTALPQAYHTRQVRVVNVDGERCEERCIAEETAVALVYNGIAHAVMMASPVDLHDFARGFSLSEGIVERVEDIRHIDCLTEERGISLQIEISGAAFHSLKRRRRQLVGATGCGLCGQESLQQAMRPVRRVVSGPGVSLAQVQRGLRRLQEGQTLNRMTGALHAAAFVGESDVVVREDVGRHNALDKLIGALALRAPVPGFIVLTSRASYELVHKTASAGIAVLVTISAPTGLAIRLADEAGLTLIGFARDGCMTVYSHGSRIDVAGHGGEEKPGS